MMNLLMAVFLPIELLADKQACFGPYEQQSTVRLHVMHLWIPLCCTLALHIDSLMHVGDGPELQIIHFVVAAPCAAFFG
jgi:hypothetical protein